MHTGQYLHYSSYHQTGCKESVVSSLLNRAYSIITNKDDLTKENARIKQVLKENGYQESIISKILLTITNQQTQATDIQGEEIRMSINLSYLEGTKEKLQPIFRFYKTRSAFYTEYILLQKIKTISFTKLTVVTAKQSTLVNLNGHSNCIQMNKKDLSEREKYFVQ